MKRSGFMLAASCIIALAALPSPAQNKTPLKVMSREAIKASVVRAQSKHERLIVKFNNGSSVSGTVWLQSDESFSVQEDHGIFGLGESVSVWFSDVKSVEGRNPFVKGVKTLGTVSLTAVLVPVAIPTCVISGLFHRPVLCPCSSGSLH